MDLERMKKWMELAKQFQQGEFWDSVFDTEYTDKFMEQFSRASTQKPVNKYPHADIFKSNHEYIIVLDLPGVRKEDVDISISDYSLNVRGIANRDFSDMTVVQTERFNGEFDRTITLPEIIGSGAKISARFEQGTLEIRIPRSRRPIEKIIID